ncbi:acyl-CoA thioesterase [Halomicrococcus gelatinilyticus]|uniref:acyl-CoA thioesterase n=1 Tax=Halomicrococcus gelatinilyticus TaxID=1702103 RepID=UPI002E124228
MPTLMDTYIENRERVQPNHANNYETAHGGVVMKWMDEIGAMSAMRFAGETCVTASVDHMDFQRPIPVGDTTVIESYVYDAGRTSVKVRLTAFRENPRTGDRERTTESHFVYVAVDDEGTPTQVPEFDVETERETELREAAVEADPHDHP